MAFLAELAGAGVNVVGVSEGAVMVGMELRTRSAWAKAVVRKVGRSEEGGRSSQEMGQSEDRASLCSAIAGGCVAVLWGQEYHVA